MAGRPERKLIIRIQSEPEGIKVEVEDTGPGIPSDNIFFTTKKNGMGIGLAICRSIIEAHGGRIRVANLGKGKGARFSFTLPTLPLGQA
jgi:signal transduction histidine kinase